MQIGYPNEKLFPRRGKEIEYMLNGKTRLVRGLPGEGAVITLNKEQASLNTPIEQNDVIYVEESTIGEAASMTLGQIEEFGSDITFDVNGKNIVCPRFAYVNGELKSEFYDIRNGDAVRIENFYTVGQLFTFLDLDCSKYDIMVNNMPADKMTKVYENFTVDFNEKSEQKDYNDEPNEAMDNEAMDNEDVKDNIKHSEEHASGNNSDTDGNINVDDNESNYASNNESDNENSAVRDITIIVNNGPVTLSGKSHYILVDLFQFYDFDLSKPKGNIVILLNGETCEYTASINDGDVVKIYWE